MVFFERHQQSSLTSILIMLVLLISSCTVLEQQDGPPSRPIDVSRIPDAVPAPVVRTRAGNAPKYTVLGKEYVTLKESRGYRERGVASWYGTKFHGRNTANGEVYDMYAMTAAHKTLPIPSYVRVTHLGNRRSIIVRINDRGPFHDNRIIDLSYTAARKLGIDATGTGRVEVEDVTPHSLSPNVHLANPSPSTAPSYQMAISPRPPLRVADESQKWFIQVGAFQQLSKAVQLRTKIAGVLSNTVGVTRGEDQINRVIVGPIFDQNEIPAIQRSLRQSGLNPGYVTQVQVN